MTRPSERSTTLAAAVIGDDAPNWGIEPVPERLRVLGGFDTFLLWTNLGISLLVLVAASYFALSLKQALLATIVGGLIGNAMLALAGHDRRRRARAVDGAAARAARAARLLPRDRAERAAVPRLGDLRADRDRDRGGRALGPRVRLPRDLGLEARLRRARDRARAARARSGSCGSSCASSGSGSCSRRSSTSAWWILDHGDVSALWGAAGPGRLVLARGRPRDRAHASRGSRSPPTTRASRPRAAPRSGASASATCCRRCSSSASARSSCSRTRRSTGRRRC